MDEAQNSDAETDATTRLGMIADSIPVGVALMSPNGDVLLVNRQISEYFGRSLDQLRDWATSDAVHLDDLPRVLEAMAHSIAAGTPYVLEERLRRADGVYRWFEVRGSAHKDPEGHVLHWSVVHIDIDDRKRVEQELREREQKLERSEALLAAGQALVSTGTFLWCMDTEELTFSEELSRIFEFEPGGAVTHARVTARIHPDDRSMIFKRRADIRASHEEGWGPPSGQDIRLQFPDGRIKFIQSKGRLVSDPEGRREWVGAIQDVTPRRLAEGALDRTRSELAHAARAMTLGALTASIAHELNQPLTGITTNAATCLRALEADPPNVDAAIATVHRTIRDGRRAADVIKRLRDLFGKKEFATAALDLNLAARDVIILLSHELTRRKVAVHVDFADGLPQVVGDRVQLQQVILNLVLNACDAMADIDDRPRELFLQTAYEEVGLARLTVQDTGIGIALDALEKLFDSFYTTKPHGMGIGLSVSRSIIERHNGRLWAKSNEGHGAAFSFAIPVVRP